MVHWRAIAQCVAVGRRGGEGGIHLLLLLLVRLVWRPLRAAAEATELLLPFASCVYFSLLCVPQWVEWSWRRWALPPSGVHRPAGAQASSSSTISSGSTWCTHSGHFSPNSSLDSLLLCGFFYFAAALLGPVWSRPGCDGLYLGLAGQPTVLLNVRQVSLRKGAARNKMSLMLCRWEQKNFTMKLVGWTFPGHHKGQTPGGS